MLKFDFVNYKKIKNTLVRGTCFTLSLGILPFLGTSKAEEDFFASSNFSSYFDSSRKNEDSFYLPNIHMVVFDDGRKIDSNQKIFSLDDLRHIISATIVVSDFEDYSYNFINEMVNIKDLTIDDGSIFPQLNGIDGSRFQDDIHINIYTYPNISRFNEEKYGFLRTFSNIESLSVGNHDLSLNLDSNFLQSLKNVRNLSLGLDYNSNFHYQDFSYLKSLYIDSQPYDACMYFSNEDIEHLEKRGVSVSTIDMDTLRKVNETILEIVKHLPIKEDSSDVQKLNAILTYVLSQFSYDDRIRSFNDFGIDIEMKEYSPFYGKGELTGAFLNQTQICGNYASMVTALSREVGLDSYNLISSTHAWNAILIDDYYYYVDATWLDDGVCFLPHEEREDEVSSLFDPVPVEEVFQKNELDVISSLDWYLEDPIDVKERDDVSHTPSFLPEGLVILPIPDDVMNKTKGESIFSKAVGDNLPRNYLILLDHKKYIVPSSILLSLLIGFGICKKRNNNKDKKRIKVK